MRSAAWLSRAARWLPPARLLVGAAIAFASYYVSSVWKAEIDADLKKYSDVIEGATAVERRVASLSAFRATARFWSVSIELQGMQAAGTRRPTNGADTLLESSLATSGNDEVSSTIDHQEALIAQFFQALPPEVKGLPFLTGLPAADLYDPDRFSICMETVAGKPVPMRYLEALFDLYKYQAVEPLALEAERERQRGGPPTLEQDAHKLLVRLDIGHVATARITAADPPSTIPPSNAAEIAVYARERQRTLRCVEKAENAILDELAQLARNVRRIVDDTLVQPKLREKRRIERAETLLYVIGGVIALYGQARRDAPAPARPDRASARTAASTNERTKKARPVSDLPHPRRR
jgi:hypothetical protein